MHPPALPNGERGDAGKQSDDVQLQVRVVAAPYGVLVLLSLIDLDSAAYQNITLFYAYICTHTPTQLRRRQVGALCSFDECAREKRQQKIRFASLGTGTPPPERIGLLTYLGTFNVL